jgi:hypothetical protein
MYDQALLRPAFLDGYAAGDVRILTSAGDTSLLSSRGVPLQRISDHLPVLARVSLEEAIGGN